MRGEAELRSQSFAYRPGRPREQRKFCLRRPSWKLVSVVSIVSKSRSESRKNMSDTPKFTVIDRRKIKAEEEQENQQKPAELASEPAAAPAAPSAGPRLVVNEHKRPRLPRLRRKTKCRNCPQPKRAANRRRPTTPRRSAWKTWCARRTPPWERCRRSASRRLMQQFYVSAMIQMGAGTQEGQRPRVDILGARDHHRSAGRAGRKNQRQPE